MTPTSLSLIDHILTNVSEVIQSSGVIVGGFSDHCITHCSRRCIKGFSLGTNVRKVRSFKNYTKAFLVAYTRLYTPLCPSVGRSVCRSVGHTLLFLSLLFL